jgi:hypothetical protein
LPPPMHPEGCVGRGKPGEGGGRVRDYAVLVIVSGRKGFNFRHNRSVAWAAMTWMCLLPVVVFVPDCYRTRVIDLWA